MKVLKAVLYKNMDAMACSMDCRHKLDAIRLIAGKAVEDIEKSLQYGRDNNAEIEGQLKLFRTRRKKAPLSESALI